MDFKKLFDWVIGQFPPEYKGFATFFFTAIVIAIALLAFMKQLKLLPDWKVLAPPPPAVPQPAQAHVEQEPLTKARVLQNVINGEIDLPTADWLYAHLPGNLPSDLPREARTDAHNAFVETVQTMSAAPRPGEQAALKLPAEGDTAGAISRLSSTVGIANPEQLKTVVAIAAPVDPKFAAETFSKFAAATTERTITDADVNIRQLDYTAVTDRSVVIGIRTGDIAKVTDVDTWMNSENDWLIMARVIDRSISATIRYLSARRDTDGVPLDGPIQRVLGRSTHGRVRSIPLGSVRFTTPGQLRKLHNVKIILQVVSVRARPLNGTELGPAPGDYVRDVMRAAEKYNRSWLRIFGGAKLTPMVLPMFGAGRAGIKPEELADLLVDGVIRGTAAISTRGLTPILRKVHMMASTTRQYIPLRNSFDMRVATGDLVAAAPASAGDVPPRAR